MQVPTDARFELACLREGVSEKEYLRMIWAKRYPTRQVKSRKGWPFVRLCDQVVREATVNVLALPVGIRKKAGAVK